MIFRRGLRELSYRQANLDSGALDTSVRTVD
jgi:hypothetical protein